MTDWCWGVNLLPWLLCNPPPSSSSGHTCSQPIACWHFHWRSGRSPVATVWYCWRTPETGNANANDRQPKWVRGQVATAALSESRLELCVGCKTDLVCDVVHYDDTVSSSVVAGRDCAKPLLTRRVPLSKEHIWLQTWWIFDKQNQHLYSFSYLWDDQLCL